MGKGSLLFQVYAPPLHIKTHFIKTQIYIVHNTVRN